MQERTPDSRDAPGNAANIATVAIATTSMTHITIQEALDGKSVEWLAPVTGERYSVGPSQSA